MYMLIDTQSRYFLPSREGLRMQYEHLETLPVFPYGIVCLLDYYYKPPPALMFTCIGFNFINTSKEKQKGILQCIVWIRNAGIIMTRHRKTTFPTVYPTIYLPK